LRMDLGKQQKSESAMKKKISILLLFMLTVTAAAGAWFYGYYNRKINDNLPTFALIAEMEEPEDDVMDESQPATVKWTFSPMMSAAWHAAFQFNMDIEYYTHIEAFGGICDSLCVRSSFVI